MHDEIIEFISEIRTEQKDEYGDFIVKELKRPVFASKKSVGMREFYQAQTSGFKPEIKFELADCDDYQNESMLVYNGFRYKILRTYQPPNSNQLEITVYGGVRDAST